MKQYFTKIIALSLLVLVFPLANSFCFQGLFDSLITGSIAQAAANNPSSHDEMDACGEKTVAPEMPSVSPLMPMDHGNSVLPCCVDGGHANFLISSQTVEAGDYTPAIFFSGVQTVKLIFNSPLYYPPLISPPKLLAVSTTILRL